MPMVSFLLGLVVLGYLFTFVVFAVFRIITGISIQRVGYSGFRHIAFNLRDGIKVNVRGVGLSVHRPTFGLPTWCSLVITELVVTVDLKALNGSKGKPTGNVTDVSEGGREANGVPKSGHQEHEDEEEGRGKLWRKLTEAKEKIKLLHSKIHWIKLLDLVATAVTLKVVGVGTVRIERLSLSVDTRVKTVDRSRLFQHHKSREDIQKPAEWKSLVRSVLFTPEGADSTELLDYATINIHGMLHNQLQGLRDASIGLKFGRLNLPYDDIEKARAAAASFRGTYAQPRDDLETKSSKLADTLQEMEQPSTELEEHLAQTVSDSREFVASILRGIQEVQFAIGFFGLSRKMAVKGHSGKDVYFNLAMKEIGLDVLRLEPKSPAHRMYFSTKDVAHQGLLTGIAISAGIDDGHEHPERMVYIPMITATVRTTLPSRTVHYSTENDASQRNTNMLYANFVCTSPSVDLDPKHLPLVRDMLERRGDKSSNTKRPSTNRHRLISQLLPKAYIKLSIQEPVVRVSLPPMSKVDAAEDDYDLLISSVSSTSLELESSHSAEGTVHYNLKTHYRHTRHQLYYQTSIGERHDLLHSDTVEVEVDVSAIPDASVVISGRLQTFTMYLVRPDICEGIKQIVEQLRKNVLAHHEAEVKPRPSFLRTMPPWLQQCRLEGSDFGIELAGVDAEVSKDIRGFALQLESWTTEYKIQRDEKPDMFTRRASITTQTPTKEPQGDARDVPSPRRKPQAIADGRRLAVHFQNLEGFIVDSGADAGTESFASIPRFEVAFSTSTDKWGPIFHINSHAKSIFVQYSLYNYFAVGGAILMLQRTFMAPESERAAEPPRPKSWPKSTPPPSSLTSLEEVATYEVTTIDVKTNLVQVKARMPADPPMMVQLYSVEAGRHRYGTPFVRSRLARLYVRVPRTASAWSRIVTLKMLRLDIRELKRKVGKEYIQEKSIDVVTDTIRFSVPHTLVVHDIFDNIANVIKTTKQLMHHFKTGTNEYVLTKEPETAKHVPRITLRTQLMLLDLEDSAFEWKLNAIYRSGLMEQKQRMAREDAFKMKEKRLARCAQRGSSRVRARSAHPDGRSRSQARKDVPEGPRRSRSTEAEAESKYSPPNNSRRSRRKMRYNTDGKCDISDQSHLSVDAARERLQRLNSQSWKNRIDRVLNFQSNAIREIRQLFFGSDDLPEDTEQPENILALNQRPGLLLVALSDVSIVVDKPSFPIDQYADFLHNLGHGMPHDMKYGLLVPMNLHVATGEVRIQMRDYPLPLLHVPALASGQSSRLPSLSLKTDFVIAEEFRDIESQRQVWVEVVPAGKMSTGKSFTVDVRRTISPVKTYSDMKFEINTSSPTMITWGSSYQPAIQDTMQIIENFTKPPVDISDRVGFWDKIRLSFHSRINVAWKGDGDVHLVLKGSRDPYTVTGHASGFVMVWRNDVRWNIAQSDDPRQFMTVDSGEYMLAVPDFSSYARRAQDDDDIDDSRSSMSSSSSKRDASFKKVVMKLSGKVRWQAGLCFERILEDGSRSFESKPHYDVVLKHPDYSKAPEGEEYDAYRGFRSNYIHMSVAVAAPYDRQWSVSNIQASNNYNAIHLTPRFFSHFFSWWSMFSGAMSLPIKQGPLWGSPAKQSKKFGRHLATLKYNLLLSPLFISHVYKHKEVEDYQENVVSATGLKMRLDSFMLDLHQRREYFDIKGHEDAPSKKSSGMRIHQAQLDFIHADLRALSASIAGTSIEDIENAKPDFLASLHSQLPAVDMSNFTIPDNDFTWVDMDDFVELDWILPAQSDPQTKILPLGYAPRFTYFRQTDHGGIIAGDRTRTSPFGEEPTHYCVMSKRNDPRRVQAGIIENRLEKLQEQKSHNERAVRTQELKIVQTADADQATKDSLNANLDALRGHSDHLERKFHFLNLMLRTLYQRLEDDDPTSVPELESNEEFFEDYGKSDKDKHIIDSAPLADYTSDFNNRFIVHNAQIKWNNSLRNIILRYIHQNSQRRGFVYYMSQRAVKFILDVIEERRGARESCAASREMSATTEPGMMSPDGVDDDATVQDRIDQLLRDGRSYVEVEDAESDHVEKPSTSEGPRDGIAIEYVPLNTYHFRLIAPQIQLQSEQNAKAAVLVTAEGMELKVVQIMDKDRVSDDVSGLVQRRFTAAADNLQMFVTTSKTFNTEHLHMYSANRYGSKIGTFWPPWVPVEMMFDFEADPYGFQRVVHKTSASLRFDKYNTLRLKYNDDVSGKEPSSNANSEDSESRLDRVWIEFPQFRAICDSAQYYTMYLIVMDLLLYSEPLEKTRSERLEKIMLASDFSDLSGAPEMVHMLQERIRQLEEIKMHFQVNEKYLDRQGWKDRIAMDQDLASCEDELFFMMKAITTAQQRNEDHRDQENVAGMVHINMSAREIVWHLIHEKTESLMEFQLKNASFDRTDNNDGSNYNSMQIGRINGFNLLPDALYPEIIAGFVEGEKGHRDQRNGSMLRVHWLMLEAIAGIPVIDYFEVNLVPLKLQIERDVVKKLFEYVFPGVGGNAFEGGGFSPFMTKKTISSQEEQDEPEDIDNENSSITGSRPKSPRADPNAGTQASLEQRLKPTLALPSRQQKPEHRGLGISNAAQHIFQHQDKSRPGPPARAATQQRSASAKRPDMPRNSSERSLTTLKGNGAAAEGEHKKQRFALHRRDSDDNKKKEKDQSDDLTQMMSRASNYMTLGFVKIPSMVLCLSYKGQGRRNIEDVHDLVFRMPTLEYRNKTWSNLDLALQLKKDFIRALVSHAGAIVSNKFSHHRPSKMQQSRLREIANMSTFMSPRATSTALDSETSSINGLTEANGRPSTASARPSTLSHTMSMTPSDSSSDEVKETNDTTRDGPAPSNGDTPQNKRLSTTNPDPSPPSEEVSPNHSSSIDPLTLQKTDIQPQSRPRATSIKRHFSGFSERMRQQQQPSTTTDGSSGTANNNITNDDSTEGETNNSGSRRSKLKLGGQKLLKSLRD